MDATEVRYASSAVRVSPIAGARNGQAERTRAAWTFAHRIISKAAGTAAKSNAEGRAGIRTRRERFAICPAAGAACGVASIMAGSIPSPWAAFKAASSSGGLALSKEEGDGPAVAIRQRVDLGRAPAARAAGGLVALPLFRPRPSGAPSRRSYR